MSKCGILIAALIAPVLMVASPNSLEAADESAFLLQDHGEVRVLRGLDPGKNFETARLPETLVVYSLRLRLYSISNSMANNRNNKPIKVRKAANNAVTGVTYPTKIRYQK